MESHVETVDKVGKHVEIGRKEPMLGTLLTFGYNGHGQLGFGDFKDSFTAQKVRFQAKNISNVSAGGGCTVVVNGNDGSVHAMGDSRDSRSQYKLPHAVTGGLSGIHITKVSCGGMHTVAMSQDGRCFTWGLSQDVSSRYSPPLQVESLQKDITDVASTTLGVYAISKDAGLFFWEASNSSRVTHVAPHSKGFWKVSAGGIHALLLDSNMNLYACGEQQCRRGQLGVGLPIPPSTPGRRITGPLLIEALEGQSILKMSCGSDHSVCVNDSGQVFVWGWNSHGQLGLGHKKTKYSPKPWPSDLFSKQVIEVAAGGGLGCHHTLVVSEEGDLYGCGSNKHGQLGLGDHIQSSDVPLKVDWVKHAFQVSVGWAHSSVIVEYKDELVDLAFDHSLGLFASLPREILFLLLGFLNPESLGKIARLNSAFKSISEHDQLWEPLTTPLYGHYFVPGKSSWKECYVSRRRGCFSPPNEGTFSSFVKPFKKLFKKPQDSRILMVGLDASGKTTILYKLKLGEVVCTIPTIGFNVETIEYRNINFTIWDVCGSSGIRALWRHYYQNTQGIIFVVDSNDRERMSGAFDSAAQCLHKMLQEDELRDAKLLVWANKQDLPNAMSASEIAEALELHSLRNREWFIQGCSAPSGDGLYEGLDWLAHSLNR